MRKLFYALGVLFLATGSRADAHALGADCKLVGDKVELEAYYDDDTPARNARVKVRDAAEQVIAEGRTDAAGKWTFARPQPGQYTIVVDAGDGHRTEETLNVPVDATTATVRVGPDRQAFTTFPWLKLGLGVGILGVIAAAFLISRGRGAAGGAS